MNNLQRSVKILHIGRPTLNRFKRQDSTCAQFKPYRYLNWYISFISNKSRTVILIISDITVLQKQILDYLSIATSRFLAEITNIRRVGSSYGNVGNNTTTIVPESYSE